MHLACKAVVNTEPHTYSFSTLYHVPQTAVCDDNVVVQAAPAWQALRWRPSILSGSTTPLSRTLPGLTSTTLLLPPTERCITLFVLLADVNAVYCALMCKSCLQPAFFSELLHSMVDWTTSLRRIARKVKLCLATSHLSCQRAALPTWRWHWHSQQR